MRGRGFQLILLLVAATVSGCAGKVKVGEGMAGIRGDYSNPWTWVEAARAHEEQGDLQRALFEYRLARTVGRSDRATGEDLRRVEGKIEARTADLLEKAERAATAGDAGRARGLYLDILALRPDHREALAALREQDERQALLGMEKKREVAKRNRGGGRKSARGRDGYADEGYAYSRESILDSGKRPTGTGPLLQELQRHLAKYPQDKALPRELIDVSLAQAEKAYQAGRLDEAVQYLDRAERLSRKGDARRQAIAKARKRYARELYSQGVILFRSEPEKALSFWRYALEFDPQNEKSRLRIRSLSR